MARGWRVVLTAEGLSTHFLDVNEIRNDVEQGEGATLLHAGRGVTKRCPQDEEHACQALDGREISLK